MSSFAPAIVLAAFLAPALLYVWLAFTHRGEINSIRDFFPLTRFLSGGAYGRSTAAGGVSVATVLLTLINLSPMLGLGLLVTIASYAASFAILYFVASRILKANPQNQTIQAFLGTVYASKATRVVSTFFSLIAYLSIFATELLVGATILTPFFGDHVLAFAGIYLVFIVCYSSISGFKAIVATEKWQIRFVVGAVLALLIFAPVLWISSGSHTSISALSQKVFTGWVVPWSFFLGVLVMNLPAPISDAGTWQRLCSTRSEADARRGLLKAILLFVVIWGSLIFAGAYIAQIGVASGSFDPLKSTLSDFILNQMATPSPIYLLLLLMFVLGLFAAMITTADSILMVATQLCAVDLLKLQTTTVEDSKKLRQARTVLIGIAVAAFTLFVIFRMAGLDTVQLIFSIYGAQLAMFPSVAAALFFRDRLDLSRFGKAAAASMVVGFVSAWASAIYGKVSGVLDWLYNAPVVALVSSALVLAVAISIHQVFNGTRK